MTPRRRRQLLRLSGSNFISQNSIDFQDFSLCLFFSLHRIPKKYFCIFLSSLLSSAARKENLRQAHFGKTENAKYFFSGVSTMSSRDAKRTFLRANKSRKFDVIGRRPKTFKYSPVQFA